MWVSPRGVVFDVPYAKHQSFAQRVLRENYGEDVFVSKAPDKLFDKGWISVHEDVFSGTTIENYRRMTFEQYEKLYSIFGDKPLFRGWTVTALFDEARSC